MTIFGYRHPETNRVTLTNMLEVVDVARYGDLADVTAGAAATVDASR